MYPAWFHHQAGFYRIGMKISDILDSSHKAFPSLEIVPPLKGITKSELIEGIRPFMEFNPPFINVTFHRDEYEFRAEKDGSFSRHLVRRRISESAVCGAIQSEFKIEVVPHLICGGATADQIESQLHDFKFMGIHNVLALRGDCITGEKRFSQEPGGYSHADELVAAIRRFERENNAEGQYCIGVGAYPEKHFEAPNLETDIANLKRKVDAGADYIITQMFFDNAKYYDFVDKCRAAGITCPIVPGLKPLSTPKQVDILPESFSLDIPYELTKEIAAHKDDRQAVYEIGQEWCKEQCRDLIAHGVPAVHFYTMGKAANIVNILRECF